MTEPLDLGPIIEMEKAATPGPWRAECKELGRQVIARVINGQSETDVELTVQGSQVWFGDDATFIAHARQYIPALLAEVVRLRREVAWTHRDQGSPLTGEDGICTCPTCQAAALDGWDPSKPLDWKPEGKP